MTVALCLGGAASVQDDWARALDMFQPDFVVACNDVGAIWPGHIDAWVTLHPEKLGVWRDHRRASGYPDAARHFVHGDYPPEWTELVEFRFPGQGDSGSSGLFTAKAALIDLGADRAVLAGIPLGAEAHFFDAQPWNAANDFRAVWLALRREYRSRIRSMSGWTAQFCGTPTTEWLATGACDAAQPTPTEEPVMTNTKLTKIAYETHPVPYDRKRELNAQGFKVLDVRFKPEGHGGALRDDGPTVADYVAAGYLASNYPPTGYAARSTPDEIADAIAAQTGANGLGTDSGDQFSDEQLRSAIKDATGKAPHHKLGRDKLIEQFNALNAEPTEETAADGLTRREITADLEGMQVEFDPNDGLEDLAALRDLAREERQ